MHYQCFDDDILAMESQPQNPETRINPENFRPTTLQDT